LVFYEFLIVAFLTRNLTQAMKKSTSTVLPNNPIKPKNKPEGGSQRKAQSALVSRSASVVSASVADASANGGNANSSGTNSRGDATRDKIIRLSAELFNQKGYAASSISDVMEVTGLMKGGIYNHFESKDDIALAAFDYASELVAERLVRSVRNADNALTKLHALIQTFTMYAEKPPLKGGCPLMNAAIESDFSHPALREHVRLAMDNLRAMVTHVIGEGIKRRQIKPSVNSDYVASVLIATLEGGIMLSALYRDRCHLDRVIDFLQNYVAQELARELA
jgi:TetR/AcrR family transcriptional regulator, transcriptional repressor for nem operon